MKKRIAMGVPAVITVAAIALFSLKNSTVHADTLQTLSFDVAPPLLQCAGPQDNVVGLTSPSALTSEQALALFPDEETGEAEQIDEEAKRSLMDRIAQSYRDGRIARFKNMVMKAVRPQNAYEVRLQYKIADLPETKGMEIQDISLMLPERFHDEETYELSCRTLPDGKVSVFRKMAPRLYNQNFLEVPVSLLPRDCLGAAGEVIVKTTSYSNVADELQESVFRTAMWTPKTQATDGSTIEFYLPRTSYAPGDKIALYAHAMDEATDATLELIRFGEKETPVTRVEGLKLKKQTITAYSYRDGLTWPKSAEVTLPADAASGYYLAVLSQKDKRVAYPFVVNPKVGNTAPVALIAATNTWHAYNRWGGASFYSNDIGKKCLAVDYARVISTQRPTVLDYPLEPVKREEHNFRADTQITAWLEKNKIDYVTYTEDDLHNNPAILDGHTIAMLPSHPEYYTKPMYDNLEAHTKKGGSIVVLGGNAIYYRTGKRGEQIEKHENGRILDLEPGEYGGFWSVHQGRSPAALVGNESDARDYNTYHPYKVMQADSPVFTGTGLKNGDTFGEDASGLEMDVMSDKTPKGAVLLAKGTNPKGYGADMVYYQYPAGGAVFSAGSISFAYGLAHDDKLGLVLNNVIGLMLKPKE